ncbi:MAG TPA: rod shape-determining protein MreC [Candidatus Omnitrophica bacterium]|nr:MAG: rod shape-determining protein MreC [Omnitrophica WOR_2 bacterium GWA2_53_43]HBO96875.1 rod shape-determining protein MreC [Candidatus Omnitrophota bacterium]HCI44670.1 rod shape-determining protein MreC [Candidatus Omnitrophota bacterium]
MLRRTPKNLIYLCFLLVPFLVFFFRSNALAPLKFKFVRAMNVPIEIISFPFYEAKKILFYHRTFDEYQRLREEVSALKARLVGQDELVAENLRLERLLTFKRSLVYPSVTASVLGRDPSGWSSSMIIDRGGGDGIRQGMPVINAMGVVGKVAEVSEENSKVVLLTDPQFSVAALIQGSREIGLMTGSLQGEICRMRFISSDAQISVGDKVVTSKLSTSFPEGLLIGEVVRIIGNPQEPSIECVIKPAVILSQVEEVLVILQ